MTIYLYVKTHDITGLKYLGQTSSKDPHRYPGSGKRWRNHLDKHGYTYTTEILRECKTKSEVRKWGLYYSTLWDVVNCDSWANLKPEDGDGGACVNAGAHMRQPEHRARMSNQNPMSTAEMREWFRENNPMRHEENRIKISKALTGISRSEETKRKVSKNNGMKDPNVSGKRRGSGNPGYDRTIYTFRHQPSGNTEKLTQYDFRAKYQLSKGKVSALVRGRQKSVNGWYLEHSEKDHVL